MTEANNQMAAIDTTVPGGRFVVPGDAQGGISPAANSLVGYMPIPWVTSAAAGWDRSLLESRPLRLAPRAGLAWNPAGSERTVLRAGAGIYPNQAAYSIVTNLAQNLPFFVTKTVNSAVALAPAFTTRDALSANTLGTAGGSNLDHAFQIEYNEVWDASVEHRFGGGTTLSAAYIGSRTVAADSATVLNVPTPGPGSIASRRPIPQLAQIPDIRWNGWATYHAFTLAARRRFSHGLMFDANWTWSHSLDDASDPGATLNETNLPQNVADLKAEKASSSFDHRHRAVVTFVYALPLAAHARGWQRTMFAGWSMAGNFTAQAGAPFTVNIASDQANIGSGPAQRPDLRGNPNRGTRTPERWFDTSVFALPALYTFGNAPRNAIDGPPLQSFDLSLHKEFAASERLHLRLSAESYNLFNHPNFNIPGRTAFASNFGSISSAQDSRQLQLALRMEF